MAFTAKPALLEHVKVGDKVTFDLAIKGGAGEVMAMAKEEPPPARSGGGQALLGTS